MKYLSIILLLFLSLKAEETTITLNGGSEMVFFNLKDNNMTSVNSTNWQLAFKSGAIAGTIRANSNTNVFEAINLSIDDFGKAIEQSSLSNSSEFKQTYNSNIDWKIGAFNQGGAPEEDYNYGWGEYIQSDGIYGNKLYVLEIINNGKKVYFQFVINSVVSNIYNISWSNLDGTNTQDFTINKATFSDKNFVYLDLFNTTVINNEPVKKQWDLLYSEYITPIQAGPDLLYYPVAGFLQNTNTWVSEMEGNVVSAPEDDTFSDEINMIGYDWKTFSGGTYVYKDATYFVQRFSYDSNFNPVPSGEIYRINFKGYTGGDQKTTVFEINSTTSSVNGKENKNFAVYPNVISQNEVFNVITSNLRENAQVKIFSSTGEMVYEKSLVAYTQLNNFRINNKLSTGIYFVVLTDNYNSYTQKLIVK